jgi:hypothetical protein
MTCHDCYVYAGAGIGFEFQTEFFKAAPSYIVYMKLWVGAEAAYSVNVNLNTPKAFSQTTKTNILLNGNGQNVDFQSKSWTPSTPKILSSDLIISVAGIQINVNFRIPVFLQWTLQTGGPGTAYAGSFYKATVTQGIVYMNPYRSNECSMTGCIPSCRDWCYVDEKSVKQGGSGPVWTYTTNVALTLYLTPIFVIEVWSGTVSGFFQVDAIAYVTGSAPSAACLSVNVEVDAAAYLWARLQVSFLGVNFINIQSSILTLFTSIGRSNIMSLSCISITNAAASNCPFAVQRAVGSTQTVVFNLLGANGTQLAALIIPRLGDPGYSSSLPSVSTFDSSTEVLRAEAQAEPDSSSELGQSNKRVSSTVKLTPHGTQLKTVATATFTVRGVKAASHRRAGTGVTYCQTQLQALRQADDSSPWVPMTTTVLDCSR